jgi:hypothetical protein
LWVSFVISLIALIGAGGVLAQTSDAELNMAVLPQTLERISWGAVIAGTVIAIVIQLAGNLLAIGIGVSRIVPDYGEDGSVKSAGMGTIIAAAVSVLLSLFVGGFIAARFAGSPDRTDALLNGLMVWGLDTLITLFLLTTTLGRLFSGLSLLLGQGLSLIGQVTQGVAQGVATVAQGAVSAAGSAAGAVGSAAQSAATTAVDAVERTPEVQSALRNQENFVQNIQQEALRLLQQVGVNPQAVQGDAQGAVAEAGQVVREAAQQVAQNPGNAQQIVTDAINRVFARGQQVAQGVGDQVGQVDRDALITVLTERGNMSREQAEQQITRWEGEYQRLRSQSEQALQEAQQRAAELQSNVARKADEVRREAEYRAREAAKATADAIAKVALAGFAAIVLGGIAAGLGGLLGAPQELPVAAVDIDGERDTTGTGVNGISAITITPNATPTVAPVLGATPGTGETGAGAGNTGTDAATATTSP